MHEKSLFEAHHRRDAASEQTHLAHPPAVAAGIISALIAHPDSRRKIHLFLMVPLIIMGVALILGRFDPAPHRTGTSDDKPPHFAVPTMAIMVLVAVTRDDGEYRSTNGLAQFLGWNTGTPQQRRLKALSDDSDFHRLWQEPLEQTKKELNSWDGVPEPDQRIKAIFGINREYSPLGFPRIEHPLYTPKELLVPTIKKTHGDVGKAQHYQT